VTGDADTEQREREGERKRDTTRVRNDYLSFKTNSRVSAKSFANQRGKGAKVPEGCDEGETERERGGGCGGEIIC